MICRSLRLIGCCWLVPILVAEGLDKVGKNGQGKKVQGKPCWQRRVEKNIRDWRKDLGRVEEMRKGVELKSGVKSRLNHKYDLLEKGCLSVATLLKTEFIQGQ